jgi:hypothetical protein
MILQEKGDFPSTITSSIDTKNKSIILESKNSTLGDQLINIEIKDTSKIKEFAMDLIKQANSLELSEYVRGNCLAF